MVNATKTQCIIIGSGQLRSRIPEGVVVFCSKYDAFSNGDVFISVQTSIKQCFPKFFITGTNSSKTLFLECALK